MTTATINTSLGDIVIELDLNGTPETTNNFIKYVEDGFYDGTIFHRVIPGFMIQGGGLDPDMQDKQTYAPITNEAKSGEKNLLGTIAMARTSDPHSATSQFFINVADNDFLDFKNETEDDYGYCVFGKVVSGMEVITEISHVNTINRDGHRDVPEREIIINKVTITEDITIS